MGRRVLIACSMIEDEINAVFESCRGDKELQDIEIRWQERGHHNDPDKLREVIQAEIDRAEDDGAEIIMLGYGLCGKGAAGWHSRHALLAMPRFDDCVNMMLCTGRRDRRNYLEAGHMYLTGGWSRDEGALLTMLDSYLERYGERKGKKLMKLMLDSYTDVTVIDTGCYELQPVLDYADECARVMDLSSSVVPGGNEVMVKLITGRWDDDILVCPPGQEIREEDFEFDEQRREAR